jgi:hypothetical protein
MMPKVVLGGAVAAVAGFLYTLTFKPKTSDKQQNAVNVDDLEKIVGRDTAQMIALDPTWLDLIDRLGEFALFAREEYKDVVIAAARIVAFNVSLSLKQTKLSFGTPRKFRAKLHAVIEAVRCMRAQLDISFPSCLEDFDEVAAEIQTTHNDYNNNMYFNSLYDK